MGNNKNRFLKWLLGLFSVLYFVFSLRIAEAKGAMSTLAIVLVVAIVLVAAVMITGFGIGAGGFLSGFVETTVGGTVVHSAAWYGYALGAGLTAGLVGTTIGQVQCLAGQDNMWFSGCSPQGGSPSGWAGAAGSPTVTYENIQCGCDFCNLTFDFKDTYGYAIYKTEQGQSQSHLLTSHQYGSSTSTRLTYSDTGLTSHTRYQYVLTLFDASGKQYQYPPLNGYTKCLAQCSFSSDKEVIVLAGEATLSWTCSDAITCRIDSSQKGKLADNLSLSGSLKVQPEKAEQTTYTLSCDNIDGTATFSTSLNVKKVGYKEVKP